MTRCTITDCESEVRKVSHLGKRSAKLSKDVTGKSMLSCDSEVKTRRKKSKIEKDRLLNFILENSDDNTDDDVNIDNPSLVINQEVKEEHIRIPNLTAEEEMKIKQIYRDRKKFINSQPTIELKDVGEEASLSLKDEIRYPIFFPDVYEILSHVQNNLTSTRWIHIKKASKLDNIILVVIEGIGLDDYESNIESCPSLKSYKAAVEFVSPLSYGEKIECGLALKINVKAVNNTPKKDFKNLKYRSAHGGSIVPLDSMFNIEWNDDASGSNSATAHGNKSKGSFLKSVSPAMMKPVLPISLYHLDMFSRLDLVMTPSEMAYEKYPLPFILRFKNFVMTKDKYTEVTEKSPLFGLDCEMCDTTMGSELTRISVVNELHEVVYEKLVKPYNRITNYLTKYSGITKKMLMDVETRLPDVQQDLRALLPSDAILVGQSLNFDLIALKMMHPYVIDTSTIFNLTGIPNQKTKLATLSAEFLSERIQTSSRKGHDSIEDSLAALKLVQEKLKNTIEWGNATLGYVRSEAESQKAHLLLLEHDKNPPIIKYRMACNALVDKPNMFYPPFQDYNQWLSLALNKVEKKTKLKNEIIEVKNLIDIGGKQVSDGVSKKHIYNYSEVAVISSQSMLNSYKKYCPESMIDNTQLHAVDKSSHAIKEILRLDSEEKKRLIIVHIKSAKINRVEKISSRLMNECKGNSLICMCLPGSKEVETSRGALFVTIPSLNNILPVKVAIDQYLQSCGKKRKTN